MPECWFISIRSSYYETMPVGWIGWLVVVVVVVVMVVVICDEKMYANAICKTH